MRAKRFRDRQEAGRFLARELSAYADRSDVLVLALPRGGVPVAYEVAQALQAPLDIFLVRKLGVPGHEELAMGAVATGGVRVLNRDVVEPLGITAEAIEGVASRELEELERREQLYRGGRTPPDPRGRTVLLVDDGLATGATMRAAIAALRRQQPARVVVAVPTASPDICAALKAEADDVVCAITPDPFFAVGYWYDDFTQTPDDEVRDLLARSRQPERKRAAEKAPDTTPAEAVREAARPLIGTMRDYDPLLARIGDAHFVLLGEASHGTDEFYRGRAAITKRLIEEKGFTAVAAEADWPDAYRVNRYVYGTGQDANAIEALGGFRRFPSWMWRNTAVVEFVDWLRAHNDALPPGAAKVGFYGLDLYSLHASMDAVLQYLERVDVEAAKRARERYACFDRADRDPQIYGFLAGAGIDRSCQQAAVAQLAELQRRAAEYVKRDGPTAEDDLFYAEQNARLVKDAESYYRSMFLEEVSSWNLRDRHMAETLDAISAHLGRHGATAKIAVWAHNSHIGDARKTQMGRGGELNIGQLVREKHAGDAVLVGFTTDHGTVTAASEWGASAERKNVRPALVGSWEAVFHTALPGRFLLTWDRDDALRAALTEPRLERAIGVIYRPETERASHYFEARLAEQFDALLHFDETRAVEPLELTAEWEAGEVPETYPFAV